MGDASGEMVHSAKAVVDSVQLTNLDTGEVGGWPVDAEVWIDNEHGAGGLLDRIHFRVLMPVPPDGLIEWMHANATRDVSWSVRGWIPSEVIPFPAGVRPVIAVPRMSRVVIVADPDGWEIRGSASPRFVGDPLWVSAMDDAQLDDLHEMDLDG